MNFIKNSSTCETHPGRRASIKIASKRKRSKLKVSLVWTLERSERVSMYKFTWKVDVFVNGLEIHLILIQ